ncbi:MAG: DAK2 domain-containing protein, partial [Bacillota bacterium]
QFFRGFARVIAAGHHPGERDGATLARALKEAADTAYRAVMKPVEGTMLSVGRAAARWAERAARRPTAGLTEVLEAAVEGARAALARTPRQLPVLAQAGVVDAGGQGLVVLLEAALAAARGTVVRGAAPAVKAPAGAAAAAGAGHAAMPGHEAIPPEHRAITETEVTFRYCTEFLVRGTSISQESLRRALEDLGDSLLVVGDPNLVKVHVHTNHPGRALEAALRWGELLSISINNMQEQNRQAARHGNGSHDASSRTAAAYDSAERPVARTTAVARAPVGSLAAARRSPGRAVRSDASGRGAAPVTVPAASLIWPSRASRLTSVVAVVSGDGLAKIFRSVGVDEIVDGGQTMNPSIEELMQAVHQAPGRGVILLPNNKNVLMTARQVIELASKPVRVVPTQTVPEGLAAALAFREDQGLDANAGQMEKACARVASGEVTYAVRDSRFGEQTIQAGDIVGMANGDLVSVGKDVASVTAVVARSLLTDGKSLLTLYSGHGVERDAAAALADKLRASLDGVELEVYYGGQPLFFYLLSAE